MVSLSPGLVAKVVQDSLREKGPEGRRVRVEAAEVRRGDGDGDWWYVPVAYYPGDGRDWAYFEMFSDVEESLEEEHHLNVLLVPRRLRSQDPA